MVMVESTGVGGRRFSYSVKGMLTKLLLKKSNSMGPCHSAYNVLSSQKPGKFPLAIVCPSVLSLCLGWQSNV